MGFGTLFVGYFLLLNFAYTGFTDAIAGVLMLYGLYKLSNVNRQFTISCIISAAFTLLGIGELVIELIRLFIFGIDLSLLNSIVSIVRVIVVSTMSAYMLLGIQAVAREVGLGNLAEISRRLYILNYPVYAVALALEIMGLFSLEEVGALVILSVFSIVLTLTLTVLILIRIYDCYAKICMPEDREMPDKPKESRFGFVNAFRRREEEKAKEYAEYKFEKFKKKMEKKRNKDKK